MKLRKSTSRWAASVMTARLPAKYPPAQRAEIQRPRDQPEGGASVTGDQIDQVGPHRSLKLVFKDLDESFSLWTCFP